MRWLTVIIYSALVIMVGVGLFNKSDSDRKMNYIVENAQDSYNDNEMNDYLDAFFVATGRNEYINKAVYSIESKDEIYGFDFSIFHSKIIKKEEEANVLVLALHNLDIKVAPVNSLNYEKNKDLIKIKITVKFLNFENHVKYSLDGKITPNNAIKPIDVFLPMEFLITENDSGRMMFNFDDKLTSSIESIIFEIEDSTDANKGEDPQLTKFAEIKSSSYEEKEAVLDVFEKSPEGILQSTKFNGEANRYSLDEVYNYGNELEVTKLDLDLLKPYNKIIYKTLGIYAVIVIVLTTLVVGYKPLANRYQPNKANTTKDDNSMTIDAVIDDKDIDND